MPVSPPQVVISDGLVAQLDDEQLEAVIRHEVVHHTHRHWRFLALATSMERALGPLPLVRRGTEGLRDGLEAWADDGAVAASGGRHEGLHRAVTNLAGDARGSRRIKERIGRLERGKGSRLAFRVSAYAPILLLAFAVVAILGSWLVHAEHAVAWPG